MDDQQTIVASIAAWLVGPARKRLAPDAIVNGLVDRLVAEGIPLWRVRVGQRVANPLIAAWGAVWSRESGAELYTIERKILTTASYHNSPFEHVITTRTSFRHSLERLESDRDHPVLFELAEAGGTGYLALPIEYGDGSVQVGAFTTDRPGGFADDEVALIEALAPSISAAMEPAAMRYSMKSLLEVYLGSGPAERVAKGAFLRGQTTEVDAAVLVTDLRGFTSMSERYTPEALLDRLGRYFEVVVEAVRAEGGDVLKFVGDGVLSVFSAEDVGRQEACMRAMRAIVQAFERASDDTPFVAALHVGPVVYGNIGSLDRLDFTVVGPTVNYVSRLEGIAKLLDRRAVCSADVALMLPTGMVNDLGQHALKGFAETQPVFEMTARTRFPPL